MNTFKVKLLDENCMPEMNHKTDACFDLKARCIVKNGEEHDTYILKEGERVLVPSGFKIELIEGWEALVRPRSGLALKKGLTIVNSPGTIDSDYRGEVGVILQNTSMNNVMVKKGERIAQMAIRKFDAVELVVDEDLNETERGEKGYGSSGV
jgi:dUTP pyrophosphatase